MTEVQKIKTIAAKIQSDNLSDADLRDLYIKATEQTPTVDTKRVISAILTVAASRTPVAA